MIMISVIWAYSNCYQFNIQTTQIFFYTKIQGSNLQWHKVSFTCAAKYARQLCTKDMFFANG